MLVLLLSVSAGEASAQYRKSERLKPQWTHKLPKPTNNTFVYQVDHAVGQSLDEARTRSLNGLISSSGMENGVVMLSNYVSESVSSKVFADGRLQEYESDRFDAKNRLQGSEVRLYVKSVAEYWTRDSRGTVNLTTLYAKSIGGRPQFDDVELTTRYGARGLWRSMIIPGWGQFHKGSYLKGGLILGGTALLAGGIIFTESQRSDYARRMLQTHDVKQIRAYQTKRDNFATGRNICIGALAALYVYNIVDAVAAPGARRLVVKKSSKGRSYAFLPTVTDEGDPMMMASITF